MAAEQSNSPESPDLRHHHEADRPAVPPGDDGLVSFTADEILQMEANGLTLADAIRAVEHDAE